MPGKDCVVTVESVGSLEDTDTIAYAAPSCDLLHAEARGGLLAEPLTISTAHRSHSALSFFDRAAQETALAESAFAANGSNSGDDEFELGRRVSFADAHGKDLHTVYEFSCLEPAASITSPWPSTPASGTDSPPVGSSTPELSTSDDDSDWPADVGGSDNNSYHDPALAALASKIMSAQLPVMSLSLLFAIVPRRDLDNTTPVALVAVQFDMRTVSLRGEVSVMNVGYEKGVWVRYAMLSQCRLRGVVVFGLGTIIYIYISNDGHV